MTFEIQSDFGPFGHIFGVQKWPFLGVKNTFFGHIFGFLCYFLLKCDQKVWKMKVLGKDDFCVFCHFLWAQKWPFFGSKTRFLVIFLNFHVIFCLNVVKMCEKLILREKPILALLVSVWGPKNDFFWSKTHFLLYFWIFALFFS